MTWRRWRFAASNEVLHGYDNPKNTLAALILAVGLGPVAAQDAALETQIVDAMNKAKDMAFIRDFAPITQRE